MTLYQLTRHIQQVIDQNFLAQEYWVQAEISELRENNGHCYIELIQKAEDSDTILAKTKAQIWRNTWTMIKPYFQEHTGQTLAAGMKVLVNAQVNYHTLFGLSLNITDIDPTYTIGDIARRRQDILRQLEAQGILTMNKELTLPPLLQNIAVISSPTAAGYQDFIRQLNTNTQHLAFRTKLFPATMQGDNTTPTIINALVQILSDNTIHWHAAVIIRGGGASSDLTSFDTLQLAENIAQFPLPIITGIGHERDDTVIDLIAHTRVKTPTAAAQFIITHQQQQLQHIDQLARQLALGGSRHIQQQKTHLQALAAQTATNARQTIRQHLERIRQTKQDIRTKTQQLIQNHNNKLTLAQARTESAAPSHILKLGYSITRTTEGTIVTHPSQLHTHQTIITTLAQGTIQSTVSPPSESEKMKSKKLTMKNEK